MSPQPPGPPPGKGCGSTGAGWSPELPRRGQEEEPLFPAAQTGAPASPTVQAPGSGLPAAPGLGSAS